MDSKYSQVTSTARWNVSAIYPLYTSMANTVLSSVVHFGPSDVECFRVVSEKAFILTILE